MAQWSVDRGRKSGGARRGKAGYVLQLQDHPLMFPPNCRAQPSIDISPAFVDNSDVDMPSIEEHLPPLPDLPPLPELPPLPVLEEYRRGLYASSSAVSEP